MTLLPLTSYSDFPTDQTFHQFHDLDTVLDLHGITSGFHEAFATGVACQQGTITNQETWFRPPFWDLLMLQLLRPVFPEFVVSFPKLFPLNTPRYLLDFASKKSNCFQGKNIDILWVLIGYCIRIHSSCEQEAQVDLCRSAKSYWRTVKPAKDN